MSLARSGTTPSFRIIMRFRRLPAQLYRASAADRAARTSSRQLRGAVASTSAGNSPGHWAASGRRYRERVYLPQNKEQTYKNILNISTVAGYQKGKPIKLV